MTDNKRKKGKEKTEEQAAHSEAPLMALLLLITIRRGGRPLDGRALILLLSFRVLFLSLGPQALLLWLSICPELGFKNLVPIQPHPRVKGTPREFGEGRLHLPKHSLM